MTEMGIEQARAKLGDLINLAAFSGEATYITRNGKRVAAIVPLSDEIKTWYVYRTGQSDYGISGKTLVEAVENNFKQIAQEAGVGNAAGYRLVRVTIQMESGWPGARLDIVATGADLAHRPAPPAEKLTSVHIFCKPGDLAGPHEFHLNSSEGQGHGA